VIEAIAETWGVHSVGDENAVKIERKADGVYVDGVKASVMFNTLQLRFTMPDGTRHILIDGRTASTFSIKEMYQQLTGAPSRG
jgi:hypothetical protein